MFQKSEVQYILYSVGFAVAYFMFLMPFLADYFDGNNIALQFLIFNIGVYIFFYIFLKSITTSGVMNWKIVLGMLFLFLALDIVMPEYHVMPSGELMKGSLLGTSATDFAVGYFIYSFMSISGWLLFFTTYIIVPALLLIAAALLIPNFVRRL